MFSIWWLLAAFLIGTYAGVLLLALMHVSGDDSDNAPDRSQPDSPADRHHGGAAAQGA